MLGDDDEGIESLLESAVAGGSISSVMMTVTAASSLLLNNNKVTNKLPFLTKGNIHIPQAALITTVNKTAFIKKYIAILVLT